VDVIELLKVQEGYRQHPYRDTAGKLTIGYGRNLEAEGIDQREAEGLLEADAQRVTALCMYLPFWDSLDEVRQAVLVSIGINCGMGTSQPEVVKAEAAAKFPEESNIGGLLGFKRMLRALCNHDYIAAAAEIRDSRAARQLPARYDELADMVNLGRWPSNGEA
jgi:lysozyme